MPVVLPVRRVALSAAEGTVQFLTFARGADHGLFRDRSRRQSHEIMAQGLDGFGFFIRIQTMQQIRHERARLELMRGQQPMAHPFS